MFSFPFYDYVVSMRGLAGVHFVGLLVLVLCRCKSTVGMQGRPDLAHLVPA